MKPKLEHARVLRAGAIVLSASCLSFSAELPSAKSIAAEMGFAWNIGNSMEVPKDPTAWGNPLPSQRLVDSVKAAGFKTIRIPCAWDSHANATTHVIDAAWLAQVKQVVDFCIKDSLFVVLNSHWDGGWLEENISTAKQTEVKGKQGAYWRQIANTFKDYDRHLLFASANEPAVQDAYGVAFGADRMAVLNSYHQTFIDSVRATGGNNASRTLVVQGPHGDIELTHKVMTTLPTDKISGHLMAEVHFYPYQFSLMDTDADWGKMFYYWGKANLSTTDTQRNATWCGEAFVDSMFTFMKQQFVDKGIPVLLGEFGAVKRTTLTGESLSRHLKSRISFYQYVASSAKGHGIVPMAWDAGGKDNLTMTMFDRSTGSIFDLGLVDAMRVGWGLPKLSATTTAIAARSLASHKPLTMSVTGGVPRATWFADQAGNVQASLRDPEGRTVWSRSVATRAGVNALEIPAKLHGMAVLRIQQGNGALEGTIILP